MSSASILRVHFPAGTPFRSKLMKFVGEPKDKAVKELIAEIVASNQLPGEPTDYLLYIKGKENIESPSNAQWARPDDTLDRFNLEPKAEVHLLKRHQALRVKHEKRLKVILFDFAAPLERWLPLVAKKFNHDNWGDYSLYISGEKEPLMLEKSLLDQGVAPDSVFSLRKPDDAVDQPMYPINQRVTISLNQQNQQGKKFMSPATPSTSSHAQPSLPPPEENIPTKTIKLNSAAKSFTKPDARGWLIKLQDKGKSEKRYCVIDSGHLFMYKTPNDPKPTSVLPLKEYFLKAKDEKKKSSGFEVVSLKEVIPSGGGAPQRHVHRFKTETEKEKLEWVSLFKKLTSPPPTGPGPKPSPPPLVKGKPYKLYGRPLEQAVENPDGTQIPIIVYKCVQYLDHEDCLTREGIFRLSGSSNQIDRYVQRLDKGEDVDLSQELDPHAVAGLLKLYFRDLPEPLMTFELYPWFLASMSTQDRALRLRYLKHLVEKLPPVNKGLLVYLLTFLVKVSTYAEVNKMALHNLATVFAPNLLKSHQSNAIGMVTDTPKINAVVNTLLQDFEYVFEDKEIDHSLTAEGKAAACCRALYDYEAKAPDELSFKKGSIIKIIHEREDGWWIGEYKNHNFGRIPATYVQKLSDKQSQEFNKRQQFKQVMKKLTDEKEEQEREIKSMREQRDELIKEIEETEARRNRLMAEFFVLKESLLPVLCKTATIPEEDKRMISAESTKDDELLEEEASGASSREKKEKKEKKDKKDKKDKKKDKKDKKAASAVPPSPRGTTQRPPDSASNERILPLSDFPKYVDDFLKESEDHRRALDGVGSTKDVFLTALEMLSGALPVKKEKKKPEPLRDSIDSIKAKTKFEAFTRAVLAERKDDLLRDLNELQLVLKLTVKRAWTSQDLQIVNDQPLPSSGSASSSSVATTQLPSPRRVGLASPPSPFMAQLQGAIGGRSALIRAGQPGVNISPRGVPSPRGDSS